ncbi:hypothetical protein [Campylobacter armoricus]|uniref:hypothetical protein n=1 Tax=Campylobacter armoricus TaxID=2505970 RepID=UPI001F3F7EEB|nr:hypothetical protein [Campylobacter armoricus]
MFNCLYCCDDLIILSFIVKMLNIDISIQTYTQILGIVVLAIGCILIEILPDKIGIAKACVIFLNLFVFNIFIPKP